MTPRRHVELSQRDLTPYVTFGTDSAGNQTWLVISRDIVVECCSGVRAVEVMEAIAKSKEVY
jgi:hypothetical protein